MSSHARGRGHGLASSSATCALLARRLNRGTLGLGTPYGIERLRRSTGSRHPEPAEGCGRSSKPCSSWARGVPAALWRTETRPTELALSSSVPSPSSPLWLRPEAALGGSGSMARDLLATWVRPSLALPGGAQWFAARDWVTESYGCIATERRQGSSSPLPAHSFRRAGARRAGESRGAAGGRAWL